MIKKELEFGVGVMEAICVYPILVPVVHKNLIEKLVNIASVAAIISSHSARVIAIGFSKNTCLPLSPASTAR